MILKVFLNVRVMKLYFIHSFDLTDNATQALPILIILFFMWFPHSKLYASDGAAEFSASHLWSNPTNPDGTLTNDEKHQRLQDVLHYIRNEAPNLVPGMAPIFHNPTGWVQHNLGLGLSLLNDPRGDATLVEPSRPAMAMTQPITGLVDSSTAEEVQALWVSPYHDKDFIPSKNAMVMGINWQQRFWQNGAQLDIHPLYGHNWGFNAGYWGAEMSLGPISSDAATPTWGKIAILNTNSPHSLMDNRHGVDLYSVYNITNQVSLNAGVRQNEDPQRNDYILLKWRINLN